MPLALGPRQLFNVNRGFSLLETSFGRRAKLSRRREKLKKVRDVSRTVGLRHSDVNVQSILVNWGAGLGYKVEVRIT